MIRTDFTERHKPKVASFYACGNCNKPFPKNEQGKRMAGVCCTCPQCGGPSDRYIGTHDKLCSSCKTEGRWKYVCMNLEQAMREYEAEAKIQNRRVPEIIRKMRAMLGAGEEPGR